MKRIYNKPQLFFEDFTLMDAIANCSSAGRMVLSSADATACKAWNSELEEYWLMSSSVGCDQIDDDYIHAHASTAIS